MKKNLFYKLLTVGIIVFFMGVSFSSAISVDNKPNISKDESEEDCSCIGISNAESVKVKKFLDRVEVYSKLLLVLSKYCPEIKDISEDLLDEITTIKEELTNYKDTIICDILYLYQEIIGSIYGIFYSVWEYFIENGDDFIADFFAIFVWIFENRYEWIWDYAYSLDCDWVPPWYWPSYL